MRCRQASEPSWYRGFQRQSHLGDRRRQPNQSLVNHNRRNVWIGGCNLIHEVCGVRGLFSKGDPPAGTGAAGLALAYQPNSVIQMSLSSSPLSIINWRSAATWTGGCQFEGCGVVMTS